MPLAQAEVADNKGATEGFIYRACISEHERKSYLSSNFYAHISWNLLSPDQKNTTFTTFLHSVRPHMYIQRRHFPHPTMSPTTSHHPMTPRSTLRLPPPKPHITTTLPHLPCHRNCRAHWMTSCVLIYKPFHATAALLKVSLHAYNTLVSVSEHDKKCMGLGT